MNDNYTCFNFDLFSVYASSKSEEVGVAALMSQEQVLYWNLIEDDDDDDDDGDDDGLLLKL